MATGNCGNHQNYSGPTYHYQIVLDANRSAKCNQIAIGYPDCLTCHGKTSAAKNVDLPAGACSSTGHDNPSKRTQPLVALMTLTGAGCRADRSAPYALPDMPSLGPLQPRRRRVGVNADQLPHGGAAVWVAPRPAPLQQTPTAREKAIGVPTRAAEMHVIARPISPHPASRTATQHPTAGNAASGRACLPQRIGCSAFQCYAAVAMVRLAQGRRGPDLFAGRHSAVAVHVSVIGRGIAVSLCRRTALPLGIIAGQAAVPEFHHPGERQRTGREYVSRVPSMAISKSSMSCVAPEVGTRRIESGCARSPPPRRCAAAGRPHASRVCAWRSAADSRMSLPARVRPRS